MKINHLQFDNFLKLNLFDISLDDDTVVHLFAGDNEAGKSSVQEAIRFALTGETVRVSTKGDYKLMIRDGAKSGSVGIKVNGADIIRDIKTAKLANEKMEEIHIPTFLPFLLDAQKFAKLNQDKRRAILIELTNTKVAGSDISRRMKAKGVDESYIEKVLPMLRSGFTATHKEAQNRAAEARQQWVGLTGNQRYGSQIAASWKPALPEGFDPKAFLAGEQMLDQLQTAIGDLNIKKGGLVAKLDEAKKALAGGSSDITFKQKDLNAANKNVEQAEKLLQELKLEQASLNNQLFNAKDKSPVTCCECGAQLRVEFLSEPGKGRVASCEPYVPLTEIELSDLQSELYRVSGNVTKMTNELSEAKAKVNSLTLDKERVKAAKKSMVTQDDVDKLEGDLGDINDQIEGHAGDLNDLSEKVAIMRVASERIRDSKSIEDRAQALHAAIQGWEKCVETLAPDGIPAEILSDTLKPVNDRLRNTSMITGWPQVTISATMEIVVESRRYSLLSESAQWRTDVAIADAIAYLSGLAVMIIDRFDVLDIKSRAVFMQWINSIMSEYETILLFGTLKTLPKGLPSGFKAHWLSNGEIEE